MPENVYVEETRRRMRSKKRDSSKDKNRGERKWHDTLEELRRKYGEHPEESEPEKTE